MQRDPGLGLPSRVGAGLGLVWAGDCRQRDQQCNGPEEGYTPGMFMEKEGGVTGGGKCGAEVGGVSGPHIGPSGGAMGGASAIPSDEHL